MRVTWRYTRLIENKIRPYNSDQTCLVLLKSICLKTTESESKQEATCAIRFKLRPNDTYHILCIVLILLNVIHPIRLYMINTKPRDHVK